MLHKESWCDEVNGVNSMHMKNTPVIPIYLVGINDVCLREF